MAQSVMHSKEEVQLLPSFRVNTKTCVCVCVCLPLPVYICLSCVVLCWQPVVMADVICASLQLSFMRAFVSVRLLFMLSAARCYNPWPWPAKSASLSSRSIVVGLCVSVAKQQLACSHTELCVMQSCRVKESLGTHTHLKNYIHGHSCSTCANSEQIPF